MQLIEEVRKKKKTQAKLCFSGKNKLFTTTYISLKII